MESLDNIIKEIEFHIPELEKERLRLNDQKKMVQLLGYLAIFFTMCSVLLFLGKSALPFLIVFGAFIGIGIYALSKRDFVYFKQRFKQIIIKTIITEFNPDLNYIPDGYIKENDFYQSKLFLDYPYIYHGEDYVSGKLDHTDFRMSELRVKEESQSSDEDSNKIVFEGVFLVADFHKYFHSETYILPETEWKSVGLNKRKHKGADLILMENEEFERNFRVFTTSDQDARYILSPSIMERILALKYKYGDKVAISFRGSNVYIALSTKRDFFEHDMSQPVDEESLIRGHLKDLEKMLATIDELNLNTRIWSKMPKKVEQKRL